MTSGEEPRRPSRKHQFEEVAQAFKELSEDPDADPEEYEVVFKELCESLYIIVRQVAVYHIPERDRADFIEFVMPFHLTETE